MKAIWFRRGLGELGGMGLALAALLFFFSLASENFLSQSTLLAVLNQVPYITIVAVGMTFVLLVGGIDLSVGSVLALSGGVLGLLLVQVEAGAAVALGAALATGILCGACNGWLSVRWRLPSFIVTLGMLEAARGGAYLVTDSRTIYLGERLEWITEGSFVGVPLPFILALAVVVGGQSLLSYTLLGRYVRAIGFSEEVVTFSGISPRPVKVAVFAISGGLTGLAAVVYTARLFSANPNAGVGLELQAIAAVVIGGTSLMGGHGSVVRSFFGVLIIAVLATGLAQMGVQEPAKRIITGGVIVLAVIVDAYRRKKWGLGLRA